MALSLLLINGPNLNLLGLREPTLYGRETLAEIEHRLAATASGLGVRLVCYQSNHEGCLIDRFHAALAEQVDGIIINPGAYAHTSIALRDALTAVGINYIEVHLTDIARRESFRHLSYLSDSALTVITGHGAQGYEMALRHFITHAGHSNPTTLPD